MAERRAPMADGSVSLAGRPNCELGRRTSFALQTNGGRAAVSIQSFELGELLDGLQGLLERSGRVFDDAGPALELIDGQTAKGNSRAARGQRVARAREVIAQHRGRKRAEEHRAGGDDAPGKPSGVAGHDLAVFRGKLIDQRDALVEGPDLDEPALAPQRAGNE